MANFETGQLTLTIGPSLTSGGGAVGSIQLVSVPEPGTLTLALVAGIVLLGYVAGRNTLVDTPRPNRQFRAAESSAGQTVFA